MAHSVSWRKRVSIMAIWHGEEINGSSRKYQWHRPGKIINGINGKADAYQPYPYGVSMAWQLNGQRHQWRIDNGV